jgi:hypothetical protein
VIDTFDPLEDKVPAAGDTLKVRGASPPDAVPAMLPVEDPVVAGFVPAAVNVRLHEGFVLHSAPVYPLVV